MTPRPPVKAGGVCDDAITLSGDEIGTRGGQIHQARDDGFAGFGSELAQLFSHDVRSGHAAAGAIDPEQDGDRLGIAGGRFELLAE